MNKRAKTILCMVIAVLFIFSALGFTSIPVKSIKLDKTQVDLQIGQTYALKTIFTPANTTTKLLTFSTANNAIASVNSSGVITGIKTGKTVITVTSSSNKKLVVKCNVTVLPPPQPLKITMAMAHGANIYLASSKNINEDKLIKKINELANVKLDLRLLDHNKALEAYSLLYASGDIPDVVAHTSSGAMPTVALNAVKAGVFLNVKPYLKQETTPNLLKEIPSVCWNYADVLRDGGAYFIPGFTNLKSQFCTYIRLDLLEKYKLKVPVTLDEYLYVMQVFKQNGVKYPTSGREGFGFITQYFAAFGAVPDMYVFDKDGKIVPSAILPAMKEALRFHKRLYEQKLLDQEFLSQTGTVMLYEKCLAGHVGIFNQMIRNFSFCETSLQANVPTGKFVMSPGPVGPGGKFRSWGSETPVNLGIYINKKVKEPERLIKFFDWMASEKGQEYFQLGEEGIDFKKVDGKIQFTYPTEQAKIDELNGRSLALNLLADGALKKLLLPFTPGGDKMQEFADKYGNQIGVPYVTLLGVDLDIYNTRPELKCTGTIKTSLWLEMASKIVYGKEPIDYFDKWVADWKARGGDTVLQQLEEKRKDKLYIEFK